MAIRIRRGNQIDFDGNKLVSGELGLVLDKGEVYFCYSPGNTKKLMTAEDLQDLLNASPEAYQALQQLIADLTADPNELANILNNISALQSGKLDKTEKGITVATLVDGKVPSEQLPPISSSASDITYDNTESGLQATDTQGAIDEVNSHLASIAINISQYPRLGDETDDQPRFERAIDYLSSIGGGTLLLGIEKYEFNTGFTLPENVEIEGQGNKDPWASTNVTFLLFKGVGSFITINSHYTNKGKIRKLNMSGGGKNSNTTAIKLLKEDKSWGVSSLIESVTIYNFGIGIESVRAYQNEIINCNINGCGIGISYNAYVQDESPTFGNLNNVENTTIWECNIGVLFASDTLNTFKNSNIELCYIAIQGYKLSGGYLPPMRHKFENCWIEANGWKNRDEQVANINPRYVLANSEVDSSYLATEDNKVPLDFVEFSNCRFDVNVHPQIPPFNTNYDIYSLGQSKRVQRYNTSERLDFFYKRDEFQIEQIASGIERWENLMTFSNKGLTVKLGFNTFEKKTTFESVLTATTNIDYSKIINPDTSGSGNFFSSLSLMTVTVKTSTTNYATATFLINDYKQTVNPHVSLLGTIAEGWPFLTGDKISIANAQVDPSTYNKSFDVKVEGAAITDVNIKINFIPNGLFNI